MSKSEHSKVFVREASGVVREIGSWTSFSINMGFVNVGLIAVSILVLLPSLFAGADLVYSALLYGILFSFQGLVYVFFTAIMPRSGGDYVWIGRTLSPTLGFISNFFLVIPQIIAYGLLSLLMASLFATPFAIWGILYADPRSLAISSWLSSGQGILVFGTFSMVFSFLILTLGYGLLKKFFLVMLAVGTVGVLALYGVMAAGSLTVFVPAFNSFMHLQGYQGQNAYQSVIDSAKKLGYTNPGFSWAVTFSTFPVYYFIISGFWWTSYAGSELKNPKKTSMIGVMGTLWVSIILTILLSVLGARDFGYDFLGASGWISFLYPSQMPFSIPPTAPSFAAIMNSNPVLSALIGIGMICWALMLFPASVLGVSRCFLAWAIDGVLPSATFKIWERFHSPIVALALACGLGELSVIGYYFFPTLLSINITLSQIVVFVPLGLAAILFAYRKKDLFEQSSVKYRIGRMPLLAVFGFVLILLWIFMDYVIFVNPNLAGPIQAPTVEIIVAIGVFAVVYYEVRYWYLKRRGIDLKNLFAEVPVE